MSDTGANEYVENVDSEDNDIGDLDDEVVEEKREREFFGDEEYTILSHVPEEPENLMSMTMQ